MEKIPTEMSVVAAALMADSGHWLMHQRPDGKHHAGLWEFPGGKVEAGEALEKALIRELREELAIDVEQADLSFCSTARSGSSDGQPAIVIQLYTCSRWQNTPEPQEGGAIGWFNFSEMRALPKPPLDEELLRQLIEKHAG